MKIATILGTRPEIIRLSRVMAALDRYVEHVIVHTGQNYDFELNQVFFNDLEMRAPDHFLEAAGKTPAETVGLVIARVDEVLASEKPDAILILGDTNSCLAAYPANCSGNNLRSAHPSPCLRYPRGKPSCCRSKTGIPAFQ